MGDVSADIHDERPANMDAEISPPPNVLLSGVVGSTAYGLAHEGSDIDRLGVFAAPTETLLGLHRPNGIHTPELTITSTQPDAAYHEAWKFVTLALEVNPAVTDLLWLPDDLYETRTEPGYALIAIRQRFLSRDAVRNSYLTYATKQLARLKNRGEAPFDPDTRRRVAKHARHMWRLQAQGVSLWTTGHLTVRLSADDAARCREFGENVAAGLESGNRIIADTAAVFDTSPTPLPYRPDETTAEAWLQEVRHTYWDQS
jgi:hypothetical protein